MKRVKNALLKALILMSLFLSAFAPFPACVDETPSWLYDGYCWGEYPVPGLPDYATQYLGYPPLSVGKAVFYGPRVMEATAWYRGLSLYGYFGGVALMTCGDLGKPVWLHRPPLERGTTREWEGPFLVVDCARRNDLYGIAIYREEVVEVDFETARRWGMIASYDFISGDYEVAQWMIRGVMVSMQPPRLGGETPVVIHLDNWFLDNVSYSSGLKDDWLNRPKNP